MAKSSSTPKRPSMATVAEAAGVNKMTVSRVFNNHKKVSAETRARVLQAAADLGYSKSKLLSSVMTQVALSRRVGHGTPLVFLSDAPSAQEEKENPVTQDLIRSATAQAERHGFRLETMRYKEKGLTSRRLNQILETRSIEGLVINVSLHESPNLELNWERLIAATSGGRLAAPAELPQVQSDIGRMLDETFLHLTTLGYQRIGILINPENYRGYRNAAKSAALLHSHEQLRKNQLKLLEHGRSLSEATFMQWCEKENPDAIVSYMPQPLQWLKNAGLKVPQDIGFVQVTMGQAEVDQGVSGIYLNKGRLAAAAVDIVAQNMLANKYGMHTNPPRTLICGDWVPGTTLKPPA